jgi:hypothetical protein
MSFDVSGIHGPRGAIRPEPHGAARAPGDAFADTLRAAQADVQVDAIPASPPAEVRQSVLAAQKAYRDMYARGRHLHFEMQDGKLHIQLQDLDGRVLREIPASKALEIAGGGSYE